MEPLPNPQKTPGRRRQTGPRNRNKNYASENDLPSSRPVYHPDSPSTPQKLAAVSGNASHSTTQKTRTKPSAAKNNRNKRNSPAGQQESPSVLAQDPIFAGSTFHASPAPSALPLPTFMRMVSQDSPLAKSSHQPKQQVSPPPTDSDETSPADEDPVSRNHESPLEFFFRADRAEKANTRRASSANTAAPQMAPFSPPDEPLHESNTLPRPAVHHHSARRPANSHRNSSPGISANELDGNPGQPLGPAFSTPYAERMRAARPKQSSAQPTPTTPRELDLSSSEALKRYLFTGRIDQESPRQALASSQHQPRPDKRRQPPSNQPYHQMPPQQHPAHFPRGVFPASVVSGNAPPQVLSSGSFPQVSPDPDGRSDHVLALEGSLRRMLKLDSVG
ncbi:hypothetical protein F5Y16DRAFT_156497 [Xylariaceae sp. FL0255]|nr:hypothetical protein F5Y16DRAFT_156497 [Xylariaceae sp. FL0255]